MITSTDAIPTVEVYKRDREIFFTRGIYDYKYGTLAEMNLF